MGKRKRVVAVVAGAALALAGAALAVTPKAGNYAGFTSGPVVNGFKPPVSFKLASSGKSIQSFGYSTFGCSGFGGHFTPGVNYYLKPYAVKKIGTIPVSGGKFSVKNVKSTYTVSGQTTTTTTSVTGKFKSNTTAKGTITFSQKFSVKGAVPCGPVSITFSVRRK